MPLNPSDQVAIYRNILAYIRKGHGDYLFYALKDSGKELTPGQRKHIRTKLKKSEFKTYARYV